MDFKKRDLKKMDFSPHSAAHSLFWFSVEFRLVGRWSHWRWKNKDDNNYYLSFLSIIRLVDRWSYWRWTWVVELNRGLSSCKTQQMKCNFTKRETYLHEQFTMDQSRCKMRCWPPHICRSQSRSCSPLIERHSVCFDQVYSFTKQSIRQH